MTLWNSLGFPLSQVITYIFMEEFELKVLQMVTHPSKVWGRCIYITSTINEQIQEITMPVLDVKMTKIKTDVYREVTHTDTTYNGLHIILCPRSPACHHH